MTPDHPQSSVPNFVASLCPTLCRKLCRAVAAPPRRISPSPLPKGRGVRSSSWWRSQDVPPRLSAIVALACTLLATLPAQAQDIWNNNAGTTNWSDPGNWSFGIRPTNSDQVLFDMSSPAVGPAIVDNIVDNN